MKTMHDLSFGTAGIPWVAKKGTTLDGIKAVKQLGLGNMELEFVRSINITKEKAPLVKHTAEQEDITLTCHGQYWVNLNASDKKILEASVQRILDASRIASQCGCWSICYHMAYYGKDDQNKVYDKIKERLKPILKTLHDEGHDLWLRPETGGKINQFADSYELIRLSEEMDGVLPCFDFAHQYSRTLGQWNTTEEFRALLTALEKHLGKKGLHNMHIHMEGIEFTQRGEKNHVDLKECTFNYQDLLRVWKEFHIKGVVVCESPNIEQDALLLQKFYKSL